MPKKPLFDKILIANRGEIALRIMKTVKRLGIKTVAVYSEADINSLHVQFADEAIYIGPSPATESYLSIEKIMEAIHKSGAQAVHPGYGFLSENPLFADRLEKEGITLIGPSASAIRSMGDKIEAKKLAQKAGVDTVPGYMGVIKNDEEAVTIAAAIGFPVMLKAAAGGGGRGMRVIHNESEVREGFRAASSEAKNSFSDDRVFIEKFIVQPRHIEIQLIADKHGNIACLGERECSIQRHHQKVIEEAPSSFIDEKTRKKMYAQVKSLSEKVGYSSAGTVEFIVDAQKNFYFLEMNTRLQVEHCVTELVTGIDLVEQMILIAAGERLSFTQNDIKLKGWAIESRIYAEDPSRGFLPSSGRITEYVEPEAAPHIRVDSGVYEGGEVSMFYDAMIAKLCTYAPTRAEATAQMQAALGEYVIRGISHNISFLEAIMANERFQSGDISTNFIAEEYPDGFLGAQLTSDTSRVFLAVALHIYLTDAQRAAQITGQLAGRERQIGTRWVVNLDNTPFSVAVKPTHDGYSITYEREKIIVQSNWILGSRLFQGMINNKLASVHIESFAGGYYLTHGGRTVRVTVRSPRVAELEKFMPEKDTTKQLKHLYAPLSGRVVAMKVEVGQEIKAGQELVIIEAMKMENVIYAEVNSKVLAIYVVETEGVSAGQLVIEFD
jgi:propionyl-CoA carboxylase alpha chain